MPGWTRRAVLALVSILDVTDVTTHAASAEDPLQGSSVPSALIFAANESLGPGHGEVQQAPGPRLVVLIPHDRAGFKIKSSFPGSRAPGPRSDAGRVPAPADRPEVVEKRVFGPRFSMTEDGTRKHEAPRADHFQSLARLERLAWNGSGGDSPAPPPFAPERGRMDRGQAGGPPPQDQGQETPALGLVPRSPWPSCRAPVR